MAKTKTKTNITKTEKDLLKAYMKTSPLLLLRLKAQAILTHGKGMTLLDIGDIVSRNKETIRRWLLDWQQRRLASIFTGREHNENASKLTKAQKQEISAMLRQSPSDRGLPKAFWSVPLLKKYIQATFGVVYESVQSYRFLLSFSTLSFKYPDTFDYHRDETLITQRMAEIRQEIIPLRRDPAWEVFASDEGCMELEAFTRRAWLKRGQRTVLKVNRQREARSYLGLLNQKSFRCHLYELSWQNQTEGLKGLKRFLKTYPNQKICIVWDNARFHKGKEIRHALRQGELLERVRLISLPPYAPDHNPIEYVWNTTKEALANIQRDNFAAMKRSFCKSINGRTFKCVI